MRRTYDPNRRAALAANAGTMLIDSGFQLPRKQLLNLRPEEICRPTRILDICQALHNGNKYVTICLMKITVEEYLRADGSNPYKTWFDRLDAQAAAKVVTAKLRLELGNTSNVKWFAGIGEYIIDWGPGYRIYLAKEGETFIILLGGGTKKGQQKDIDQAKALHAEYKDRKKALTAVKKGKR